MSLLGPVVDINTLISISGMDFFSQQELDYQKEIVLARKYHEGDQGVELTTRLRQFLGINDVKFRMNMCRNVVTAVSERLAVAGFDSADEALIEWAWNVWRANNLSAIQEDVYEDSIRDGVSFMVVSWDDAIPKMTPHQRFTDISIEGGTGEGCWIVYEQNDPKQEPMYGVKQWADYVDAQLTYHRNLYYPDRVVKYISNMGTAWTVVDTVPWVTLNGEPLGIAVVDFQNKDLRCEAWDAIPLQNAINKSLLDLLASADLTAFRIFYALGFIPTTDGKPPADDKSNWLKVEPGQVVGSNRSAKDTEFGAIQPAELNPLLDLTHQLVLWMASVTNTPVSRFISTKLIASDETLKEQEGPLLARVASRQTRFGNAWSKCFKLARKLQNTFGGEKAVDEEISLVPIWGNPAARGESERLDLLAKKQLIGIPQVQLWKEAGYDQNTINKMTAMVKEEGRDANTRGQGQGQGQQ